MNIKIYLLLFDKIGGAGRRIHLRQPRDGFSLPLFVAIGFILLVGGALIANRAAESVLSGGYSSRAREAQKAAEAGAAFLMAQLNAQENRHLLVNQPPTATGKTCPTSTTSGDCEGTSDIKSSSAPLAFSSSTALNLLRHNPCKAPSVDPDYTKIYPGGDSTKKWYIQSDGTISTTPSNLSFRLHRFQRESIEDLWISRDRTKDGTNRFIIQVVGESLRDGKAVATATLEQDWDVAPKCCGVAFGGKHGSAEYGLDSDGETLCIVDGLGLGILAGAAGTETGAITIKGKSTDVITDEGEAVDPIYCLSETGTGCSISVKSADITVDTLPQKLPGPKSWADPSPSVLTDAAPTPGAIASCVAPTGKSTTVVCGGFSFTGSPTDSTKFAYCADSGCKYTVINPTAATLPSFCKPGSLKGAPEVHCNLTQITPSSSNNIIFNTKSRRIVLYFPTSGTKMTSAGGAVVGHCALSTTTFDSKTLSTACGAPESATRLSLFGCASCGTQSITLNGTPDLDLNAFIYFPLGNIELVGDATISGIVWSNTLSSTGNPTWTVPGSGLGSVLDLMGLLPDGDEETDKNPLRYEMVARSLNRSRWISNP